MFQTIEESEDRKLTLAKTLAFFVAVAVMGALVFFFAFAS
jgi:hypothetical protein